MRNTVSILKSSLTRFGTDTRGSMATLFAVTSAFVFLAVGATVDYGSAAKTQTALANASDAASLAAAKLVAAGEKDTAVIVKTARDIFDANLAGEIGHGFAPETFTAVPDFSRNAVTVNVGGKVQAHFMQLAGFETIPVAAASTSEVEDSEFEISMMLDLTGSMEEITADKKGRKIDVLELAAENLVNTLIPAKGATGKVRIAIAPFAPAVNAGALAKSVSAGKSTGCVLERVSGSMDVDVSPSVVALKKGSGCPGRSVMELTKDRKVLLAHLDKLTTGGSTAGHLGTAWAFGLLSPAWADVLTTGTPKSYSAKGNRKIAILMTDGLYNTYGGSMTSANVKKSMEAAVATCKAMRNAGVIVYTVGFELNDPDAKATLKDCASEEAGKPLFFDAKNGAELLAAYEAIVKRIQSLRISA